MDESEKEYDEQIIATAVRYLLDGGEEGPARTLLSCKIELEYLHDHYWNVVLTGPRGLYDLLRKIPPPTIRKQIEHAFEVALDGDGVGIEPRYEPLRVYPGWYDDLLKTALGENIHNQGRDRERRTGVSNGLLWQNLHFRSRSEVKIAEALEEKKVLFLPDCMARLGFKTRENREPDFLICHKGKWGILEVDGEPFHPATRTTEDHARDDLFQAHGIKLVKHYDASECYNRPAEVVKKFLFLLEQNG